jgi:superfamily I DNA/RNA helicase
MSTLNELNDEQRLAVLAGEGPVTVIAGPGTGKTKTLTARIAHLIDSQKARPEEIVALTFTNKAAREILSRITSERDDNATGSKPVITTFHGLAYRWLDTAEMGELVSEQERNEILRSLKKVAANTTVRDLSLLISRAKNQLQPLQDVASANMVAAYNAELAVRNTYDFDDLLLQFHAAILQGKCMPHYRYVLVDEFQDTNDLQYELLKSLKSNNLFVIGDPLQSIYGFRGASAAVFDRFRADWPETTEITLTTNYRSVPQVVKVAAAIFPDALALRAHRQGSGKICALEVLNEYGEADWIVNEIERQVGGSDMLRSSQHHATDQQRTFRDFAIIYRTHAVAKTIQRTLEASGIPYQIAGEGSPYSQPHVTAVTDTLAYLAGQGTAPAVKGYSPQQIETLLDPLKIKTEQPSLTLLVSRIIDLLGLATEKHAASLRQFSNTLVPFDGKPIEEYLNHLRQIAEQEYYDPNADAVTLLTIHAAKGLEFSRVFLAAAEEGALPHARPGENATNQEEEQRLFYVAVTRARDELYILHARNRAGKPRQLSRFVASLPKGAIEHEIDPTLAEQKRRIERHRQKRAQASLF